MSYTPTDIAKLRSQLGVGIMDAKRALEETSGDLVKAEKLLRGKGAQTAEKKRGRSTKEGWIGCYVHSNGKEGALVSIACETDFVSLTTDFQTLAHDLAMHVVAARPKYISSKEVPADVLTHEESIWREQVAREKKPEKLIEKIVEGKRKKYFQEACLLDQLFIKDDSQTIEQLIHAYITKLGENIQVTGFHYLSV